MSVTMPLRPDPPRVTEAPASVTTRVVCAVLGLTSVAPLMAWVYGLGSFRFWFLAVTVPGTVALVSLAAWRAAPVGARRIITVGVFAGVIGTLGYDVFRIPFVFGAGYRLLSPIESYGVLLTGASTSSGWTDFAGWAWHLSNGVGFAITYVAVAERKRWWYGVAWAMVLESSSVLTPFAGYYALRGNTDAILIAYGAHVPFGLAIGWAAQHSEQVYAGLREMTRVPNAVLLGGAAFLLAVWLQPWDAHRVDGAPPGADASVLDGRLHPEFLRVGEGGCAVVANLDDLPYEIGAAEGAPTLAADTTTEVCFDDDGVHRLPIHDRPFRGGFVIVDPTARGGPS